MTSPHKYWYVAVTYRKERVIKHELDKIKVESFIPIRKVVKEIGGKKKKVWQLVMSGYVFIYTDHKTSIHLTQTMGLGMQYLKDPVTLRPVPYRKNKCRISLPCFIFRKTRRSWCLAI